MVECPRWVDAESDDRLRPVVRGITDFSRFILKKAATHILRHGDLKSWHEKIFRAVVPLSYYAGNYRSPDADRPCLRENVQVDGSPGVPYEDVPRLMAELSEEMAAAIHATDRYIATKPTPSDRARATVQLAALYSGKFIRIHPFMNGNGRMSRLIANYVLCRYGYPLPYYDAYPRPGGGYAAVSAACMAGNFDLLYQYLLLCLAPKSP